MNTNSHILVVRIFIIRAHSYTIRYRNSHFFQFAFISLIVSSRFLPHLLSCDILFLLLSCHIMFACPPTSQTIHLSKWQIHKDIRGMSVRIRHKNSETKLGGLHLALRFQVQRSGRGRSKDTLHYFLTGKTAWKNSHIYTLTHSCIETRCWQENSLLPG